MWLILSAEGLLKSPYPAASYSFFGFFSVRLLAFPLFLLLDCFSYFLSQTVSYSHPVHPSCILTPLELEKLFLSRPLV